MMMSRKRNRPEEWGDIEPSPVIHINELPEHTLEIDLEKSLGAFGRVHEITILPNKRQALVEFEEQAAADTVIQRCNENQFIIGNQKLRVTYSTSKRLTNRGRPANDSEYSRYPPSENHILLLTIYNARYPINVDVIHQVTNRHGKVLRIVIFRRKEVQAMVEFASNADAREAKRQINGADIYSGCCSLKVEFAKQFRLKVTRNNMESWDYENPNLESGDSDKSRPTTSLLGKFDTSSHLKSPVDYASAALSSFNSGMVSSHPVINALAMVAAGHGASSGYQSFSDIGISGNGDRLGSPVLMVYNLDANHFNCDRLFNLFCLYGNVGPVKFLRSKEGTAMVEMGDVSSANCALANLPMITFCGLTLNGQPSRQSHITDVIQPFELPDGTPSFKDFSSSRNNRYTYSSSASKNRVYPPSNILHFWNCPPNITSEDVTDIFSHAHVSVPTVVSLFQKSERSSSGILEFKTTEEACEALIICNHTSIPQTSGRYPFIMRLAFSSTASSSSYDPPRRSGVVPSSSSSRHHSGNNGWHQSSS